jgi:hypothetical protein
VGVQVLPFSAGVHPAMEGAFSIPARRPGQQPGAPAACVA